MKQRDFNTFDQLWGQVQIQRAKFHEKTFICTIFELKFVRVVQYTFFMNVRHLKIKNQEFTLEIMTLYAVLDLECNLALKIWPSTFSKYLSLKNENICYFSCQEYYYVLKLNPELQQSKKLIPAELVIEGLYRDKNVGILSNFPCIGLHNNFFEERKNSKRFLES